MAHQRIQFLLQSLPDFIQTIIIFHQMIAEQRYKHFIRNLHVLHKKSFLRRFASIASIFSIPARCKKYRRNRRISSLLLSRLKSFQNNLPFMPPLIVIENSIIIKQLAIDYIQLSGKHVCLYLHIRQLAHKFCCRPLPFRLIFCQKIVDCFQQGIRWLFPQFRFCLFEFPDAALPVKLYSN